ncbi:GntR family transcriptional regulator / MocR family aminotransferase [Agromyces sp. CF514]|uniref:MocR-like pyridoxine biosynthesis transcription factor PdxR n=1 Tax=Agromyces sp. CF514 TaxID=1881031 RepID=UPI0008ED2F3D|nr:PLP-dependent aminotransferase family protein [Agromyces sp. CF514]SFR91118.1 GntR family transcriptional regulator / MocR family aminotransferase [Agromyces sp. CF514]
MPRHDAPRTGPALAWETLLPLGDGPAPLRDRLERAIRDAVHAGVVPAGSALPPSRVLAETLGVSRWVVTETYGQLVAEGFLEAVVGSGTRVPEHALQVPSAAPPARTTGPLRGEYRRPRFDLGPGIPDLRHVPRARWAAAVRHALDTLPDAELMVVDPLGHPLARTAVAAYLARSRRAIVSPDDVVVTHGATDGMTAVVAGLRAGGHRSILVEDPSWGRLREVAAAAGLTPVPVPVDDAGVDVERLAAASARTGARAALLTPAHQFPVGAALSPARRDAIVRWARAVDGVLIEDDYDAEFRYDRRPIAALQGLAPERVVLVGSLSKSMAQAFGLGWAVIPAGLRSRMPTADRARPSVLDQVALAQFIASGDLERHLRAARGRFRRRRAALLAAFQRELPELPVTGIAAGMHAMVGLPPGVSARDVRHAASGLEVAVSDLARYRATAAPGAEAARSGSPDALVVGYGNLSDALVDEAVARLAAAIRTAAATAGREP